MQISDRLIDLTSSYRREMRRCLRANAFLAATIMAASAFEAGLLAMCFLYPAEVKRTTIFAKKRFRGKRYRALEFSLSQLIGIADELNWLPAMRISWAGKRTNVAGYAHEIRQVRNRVHPGVWARDGERPLKFTKGVYRIADEVITVANSWLLHRVEKDLLKAMRRREKRIANS